MKIKKVLIFLASFVASYLLAKYLYATFLRPAVSEPHPENSVLIGEVETTHSLTINNKTFQIALADTPSEQEKGLGGVASMPADAGMLFVFDKPDKYGFWMKDTLIPLDMIWIDEEKKIVYIEQGVLPESYPKIFTPETSILYVLELNSGLVDKHKIKIGDFVQFSLEKAL